MLPPRCRRSRDVLPGGGQDRWNTVQVSIRTAIVYNLTIADIHTYYVLVGTSPVLVHNDNDGGAGKNDPHGDGGRRGQSLLEQIADLEEKLKDPSLSRREKVQIKNKIQNLKEAANAAKGETHGRRGKGC